jgi:glycosyltransferase involved in cell wall biosynthesis
MCDERVSVVVPVYNGARYLTAAIESILAQETRPLEIIIVDDGSTDDTPRVVNRFSDWVFAIHQDNLGPSAARNNGIKQATAPLVAFLDADDMWLPTALTHHLAILKTNPAVAIGWGPFKPPCRSGRASAT